MANPRITSFLLGVFILLSFQGIAQKNKDKRIKKADAFYKELKYNSAIPLYEEYIAEFPKKKNTGIKTKLAYSYKMTNQIDMADSLYQQLVQIESIRPEVYYYYGEGLMAQGKYDDAKTWFLKFDEAKPEDERGIVMAEACDKIKKINPIYNNVKTTYLPLNTEADDFGAMPYGDQIIFVSDYTPESKLGRTRQFEWTGRGFLKLLVSKKDSTGSLAEFEEFSKRINIVNKNLGPSVVSQSGDALIFTRNSDVMGKRNQYNMQLFIARKKNDKWDRGVVLPFCNPNNNYMHPTLSWTGDTLYFVCDKKNDSFGGTDIFMVNKKPDGEWTRPENVGPDVNTPENEGFPYIGPDGALYFTSKGHPGYGGFDIFKSTTNRDGFFANVKNVGHPINSPKDDTGFYIDSKGLSGYFSSSRKAGNDDIYSFEIMQVFIEGRLTDKDTKKPISNASISLISLNGDLPMKLNNDGSFKSKLDYNQDYLMVVEAEGFKKFEQKVSTRNTENGQIIELNVPMVKEEVVSKVPIEKVKSPAEEEEQ